MTEYFQVKTSVKYCVGCPFTIEERDGKAIKITNTQCYLRQQLHLLICLSLLHLKFLRKWNFCL